MHPPFLYLGYVGFSMAFSFSVAALLDGKVDALWARWLRPWVLSAWSFLTIGISIGSLWAYYELGWGGWWFWDPVENASLLPWLAATALLHCTLVVERRHALVNWTIMLGILTFSLSLIGTFLVRSGVLTSVHAFATDPERGVYILLMLMLASGGALTLYSLRSGSLRIGNGFNLLSKEAGLTVNNILLVCATAVVFLGTFYPLLIDLMSNDKITVGPPFFNLYFGVIFGLIILFMGIGPLLKWRSDNWQSIARPIGFLLAGSFLLVIGFLLFGLSVLGGVGLALAFWLFFGTLISYGRKIRLGRQSLSQSWQLAKRLPAGVYGFLLAHIGVAVMVVGVTSMGVWSQETILMMRINQQASLGGYTVELQKVVEQKGANYTAETAVFNISKQGRVLGSTSSERRFYPVRGMQTTEAGIYVRPSHNLYLAIGEGDEQRGWAVRIYFHPFVSWIWIGSLFMAFGGFVALADRRLRLPKLEPSRPASDQSGKMEPAQ